MTETRIPKTGDAVEEGTLSGWLVADGGWLVDGKRYMDASVVDVAQRYRPFTYH